MPDLLLVYTYLAKVPDTVWAALTASALTLSGVWLTARMTSKQFSAQLAHDATQRERERQMSLRRDVYLPAAQSLSQTHRLLTALSDIDRTDDSINRELADSLAAISAVHVIAQDETVCALTEYMNSLTSSFAELYPTRLRLRMRKNDIDILTDIINRVSVSQDQTLEMMKQYNLEARHDPARWAALEKQFKQTQELGEQHIREQERLWDAQVREQTEFAELCMLRTIQVAKLMPRALFSVRDELELPLNKERYQELQEASASAALAALQKALQRMKSADPDLDK